MRQIVFDWLHQLTFHGSPVCVEVLKYQKRLITFFTETTTQRCRRGRRLCGGVQPVWPDLEKTEHTWAFFEILFNIWPNFWLTLVNYFCRWANFNVVNGQILKKITCHLVTLHGLNWNTCSSQKTHFILSQVLVPILTERTNF